MKTRAARDATSALAAAFGPGAGAFPGPLGDGAFAWLRGVELAGRGRFAAARAAVADVRSGPFAPASRALEASMLRQVGRHRDAASYDGRALALAVGAQPCARADAPGAELESALRVDALTGLAADALGVGRFALAERLLDRAAGVLDRSDSPQEVPWWTLPRARLRHDWVTTELAVYTGDSNRAEPLLRRLLRIDPGPALPRHHAKTQLIAAAAAAATGDSRAAVEHAQRGYHLALDGGMNPLQWAGAQLVAALTGAPVPDMDALSQRLEAGWIRDGAQFTRL